MRFRSKGMSIGQEERLWWSAAALSGRARVEALLSYLGAYPLGRHNRAAAEAVERHLHKLDPSEAAPLRERLRALRDPMLPPVEANTLEEDEN